MFTNGFEVRPFFTRVTNLTSESLGSSPLWENTLDGFSKGLFTGGAPESPFVDSEGNGLGAVLKSYIADTDPAMVVNGVAELSTPNADLMF